MVPTSNYKTLERGLAFISVLSSLPFPITIFFFFLDSSFCYDMKERTRYGILHLVSFCLMIYVADQSILVSGKLHAFLKFLPWVYNYLTG